TTELRGKLELADVAGWQVGIGGVTVMVSHSGSPRSAGAPATTAMCTSPLSPRQQSTHRRGPPARRSAGDLDDRFMFDGEVHRVGDEALRRGVRVQSLRGAGHLRGRDNNPWSEYHLSEASAAVGCLFHRAAGLVGVGKYGDASRGAQMQVPEHVARRKRG